MKIRALVSFSGSLSMRQGEVREVTDETGKILVKAGHAEKVSEQPAMASENNEDVPAEKVSEQPVMASENSGDEPAEKTDESEKAEIAPVQHKKAKKAEKNAD